MSVAFDRPCALLGTQVAVVSAKKGTAMGKLASCVYVFLLALLFSSAASQAGVTPPPVLAAIEGQLLRSQDPVGVGTVFPRDTSLDVVLGTFRIESADSDDLRVSPGIVTIETIGGGTLSAAATLGRPPNEVRNVDPATGRPRILGSAGQCTTGLEPACWFPGDATAGNPDAFAALCDLTRGSDPLGYSTFDPAACSLTLFNSLTHITSGQPVPRDQAKDPAQPVVSALLANGVAGNTVANSYFATISVRDNLPFVVPNAAPSDSFQADEVSPDFGPHPFFATLAATLNEVLSDEQEALLGCGSFWGHLLVSDCEADGIDLANTEASALLEFLFAATEAEPLAFATTSGHALPGTTNFVGPPPGLRFEGDQLVQIAGARSPWLAGGVTPNPDYDMTVDGDPTGMVIPAEFGASAGQQFMTESAALSFNLMLQTVALSAAPPPGEEIDLDEFLWTDPYALDPLTDPRQCSFAKPQFCREIKELASYVTAELEDDPSGPPAVRWLWETGAEYDVTAATGDLAGFAGGTLHALGPEVSRVAGAQMGVAFVLVAPDGATLDPNSGLLAEGPDGLVDTADDPGIGVAYGVVPEPRAALLQWAALAILFGRAFRVRNQRSRAST